MPRILPILILTIFATSVVSAKTEKKMPVYVGAGVCASCHDGSGMGHQMSKWLVSKHAAAYAVLSRPGSKQIAKLSGIPDEPLESPMCLGCHATGAEAEDWEKDDTFHTEDGVQCEKCHGAGSEYMDLETMKNRKAAMAAGLRIPTVDDCVNCHTVKGSHVAVHNLPQLDLEKAIQYVNHPTPDAATCDTPLPLPKPAGADQPKYIGSNACGACHKQPAMGYQLSQRRLSAHAHAYGVLGTDKGFEHARSSKLTDEPQHSPQCLQCHTTFWRDPAGGVTDEMARYEGVGCEACHGPGSKYATEAVMRDKAAAKAAGLRTITRQTCVQCHPDSKDKPFDFEAAKQNIAHPTAPPKVVAEPIYKNPINMALLPDGKGLFVACESSDSVIVVDAASQRKVAEIPVGRQPNDIAIGPNGKFAYVTSRLEDAVSVIDVAQRKVVATLAVGDEPHGILTDAEGKYLYILNTSSDSISVIDAASLTEVKRLAAGRNPWSLSLSPDGSRICVTNNLSQFVPFRTPPKSEITVIDTQSATVLDRPIAVGTNLLQGVAWHPSGDFAIFTLNRTKNLVPMTRLLQGWTITNGIGLVWKDGRIDQVLLDQPDQSFPDAADVAVTPDGKLALVTSSSTDRVAVVDIAKLLKLLKSSSAFDRETIIPNHLGKSTEFIIKHIVTKTNPRGILITPDGRWAFVACTLDDSLTVIDLATLEAVGRIDLGGPTEITKARFGERLFNNASITFRRQFSCHSCHPDGHVDGLTYDIEADGIGISPVDNRTLRGILDTAPFKWEGTNPSLQRQCGARLAVFFTRLAPFTPEQLSALDLYICTIPRPPNRYRPLGAPLTDAQRRGREIFQRTTTNDGREIPALGRCATCHFPPLYTDRRVHDVGTQHKTDRQGKFDTPHLNNIYDSAPYLHNGIANSLEEIWTRYNPYNQHGVTNDMTKDQLNDLIEYLKTL